MWIEKGSFYIRPSRIAIRYLGNPELVLSDREGFVDTGDMVKLCGERHLFAGRKSGIMSFGRLNIYPEAVEAVINQHPSIHMSRVFSRSSPVTGALVVAEVVLMHLETSRVLSFKTVRVLTFDLCRNRLQPYLNPAMLREAWSLELAAGGKLVRHHA